MMEKVPTFFFEGTKMVEQQDASCISNASKMIVEYFFSSLSPSLKMYMYLRSICKVLQYL